MRVIQLIATELSALSFHWLSSSASASDSCDFLSQELSHLLLYVTHMFQSGAFSVLLKSGFQLHGLPVDHSVSYRR